MYGRRFEYRARAAEERQAGRPRAASRHVFPGGLSTTFTLRVRAKLMRLAVVAAGGALHGVDPTEEIDRPAECASLGSSLGGVVVRRRWLPLIGSEPVSRSLRLPRPAVGCARSASQLLHRMLPEQARCVPALLRRAFSSLAAAEKTPGVCLGASSEGRRQIRSGRWRYAVLM